MTIRRPDRPPVGGPRRSVGSAVLPADTKGLLDPRLKVSLSRPGLVLGTWGQSDLVGFLPDGSIVAVEEEITQKHPSTNVLKYWPWLTEDRSRRLFLVHIYQPAAQRDSNRQRLSLWTAARMEKDLRGRFGHATLRRGSSDEHQQLRELLARYKKWTAGATKTGTRGRSVAVE